MKLLIIAITTLAGVACVTSKGKSMNQTSSIKSLPSEGIWRGHSQCQEHKTSSIDPNMNEDLTIRIQGMTIYNDYPDNDTIKRSNVMNTKAVKNRPKLLASPDLIKGFLNLSVLSETGISMFEDLIEQMESDGTQLENFRFIPNDRVVSGTLACNPSTGWCHYEAKKKISVKPEGMDQWLEFEVEGGDIQQKIGDNLYRVGYAFDNQSTPGVEKIWVCEAVLERIN